MTDAEKKAFEEIKTKLDKLERAFLILLRESKRQHLSSVRRQRNIIDREEKFAALCDDLAASVDAPEV